MEGTLSVAGACMSKIKNKRSFDSDWRLSAVVNSVFGGPEGVFRSRSTTIRSQCVHVENVLYRIETRDVGNGVTLEKFNSEKKNKL